MIVDVHGCAQHSDHDCPLQGSEVATFPRRYFGDFKVGVDMVQNSNLSKVSYDHINEYSGFEIAYNS